MRNSISKSLIDRCHLHRPTESSWGCMKRTLSLMQQKALIDFLQLSSWSKWKSRLVGSAEDQTVLENYRMKCNGKILVTGKIKHDQVNWKSEKVNLPDNRKLVKKSNRKSNVISKVGLFRNQERLRAVQEYKTNKTDYFRIGNDKSGKCKSSQKDCLLLVLLSAGEMTVKIKEHIIYKS